jgi:hypothetical protein
MKRFYFLFFLLLPGVASAAQWSEGSVVLANDSVIVGELEVRSLDDVVLFRNGSKVDVYPSHKVRSVLFFDASDNIVHRFVSIQTSSVAFSRYLFYEVVVNGEVSVLRRRNFRLKSSEIEDHATGYHYLIRFKNEFTSLHNFGAKVYPKLKRISINEFALSVKKNKLNPHKQANAIRIIQLYNEQASAEHLSMN